ncbi:dihydrodipicolinate reductase [Planctomycetota bacterium]
MTIKIMINGLPGNMAAEVTRAAAEHDLFEIIPHALTGPEITDTEYEIAGITFGLILPAAREEAVAELKEAHGDFISIDFSHPSAVNDNAAFYCSQKLPFVMGTTGGDRETLAQAAADSGVGAVIAPNMAKQIVGLQMMLEYAAENFPGLFSGYAMQLEESHQAGKADTSGTAKAMVGYFNRMGIPFDVNDIVKVRDPETQKNEWRVPEDDLKGHAYHTYALGSEDGTVDVQFRHNVRGRRVYALGTLDAVRFLHDRIGRGEAGLYSMLDVLRSGAMGGDAG